jgi:hypothetical protein
MKNEKIYFLNGNRNLQESNVKTCYGMIMTNDFQPSIGKLKAVKVSQLKGVKLYSVSVKPKKNSEGLSIKNFQFSLDEVNEVEDMDANVIVDGQHRYIAMLIMEMLEQKTFEEKDVMDTVEIPSGMPVNKFISLINSGKPWTNTDMQKAELPTNNSYIDYMETKMKELVLKADVVYSLYTLGQSNLTPAIVKDLKRGINKLPKRLELNTETQDMGDKILAAFKESKLSDAVYNNGKFAKGFKMFYKQGKPELEKIEAMIKRIDKDLWFNGEKPEGSPEQKQYCENFIKWYNNEMRLFNKE